jgi:hypothetical protein
VTWCCAVADSTSPARPWPPPPPAPPSPQGGQRIMLACRYDASGAPARAHPCVFSVGGLSECGPKAEPHRLPVPSRAARGRLGGWLSWDCLGPLAVPGSRLEARINPMPALASSVVLSPPGVQDVPNVTPSRSCPQRCHDSTAAPSRAATRRQCNAYRREHHGRECRGECHA